MRPDQVYLKVLHLGILDLNIREQANPSVNSEILIVILVEQPLDNFPSLMDLVPTFFGDVNLAFTCRKQRKLFKGQ